MKRKETNSMLETFTKQAKPRKEKKITYFCRLCRKYNITSRKAHLQNFHGADRDTMTKKSNNDLIDVVFIESK